jgi:SGNH hydrolase-like domain, acetyltransferase AlgX
MRATKIIFLAAMGALLVLPGAQMIFRFFDIPLLQEYRRLTPFPDLTKTFTEMHGRLSKPINEWFDDNVGFRPLLTRINNQIDYSLFDYSRNVIVGKDGWFFDKGWLLHQVEHERQGDELQKKVEDRIVEIAQYLARRNMKLVVVTIPLSETVYPEFLPASAPLVPHPSRFDKFNAFLKSRSDLLVVDGLDVLLPQKSERLFFKTDIHYNPRGAYLIAEAVVKTISAADGRNDPWRQEMRFSPVHNWHDGMYRRFLSILANPPVEDYLGNDDETSFDEKHPPRGQTFEAGTLPFETVYHNDPSRPDRLPAIVLFGNSFSDWFVGLGMYENFKAVYRARGIGSELGETMRQAPDDARYFVFQLTEPFYDSLTGAEIPATEAAIIRAH